MSAQISGIRSRLSKYRTVEGWRLQPTKATFAPSDKWSNKDMDVVPQEERTWTAFNYVTYWISDAFNISTWNCASGMLAMGLSWRQALVAIVVGHTIVAVAITLNGTIGARLRIPFPVQSRSSFGFYFSYFAIISRVVLACFWYGIQTYTGGLAVRGMIKAIWPSFARLPNHLPESADITTQEMISYFLYWAAQVPFCLVSMQRIRWLFLIKSIVVPCCAIAMLIWALVRAGPGADLIFARKSTLGGSKQAWAMVAGINSVIGNYATLSVNINDFTRYAKNDRAQYIQLAIIPTAFTFWAFVGIVCTSIGEHLYGRVLWEPSSLIDQWDNRAAAFFASFSFALATLGANISANSISAANDFTAMAPRYLNIKRGALLTAFVGGWCLVPWKILASAQNFLSFMANYTVFLAPIAALLIADYWIVHGQKIYVPDLYRPHGIYRYTGGVNFRALAALVVSVGPNMPGLINSINSKIEVGGAQKIFNFAWLFGFFSATFVYIVLSWVFPPTATFAPNVDATGMEPDSVTASYDEKSEDIDEKV